MDTNSLIHVLASDARLTGAGMGRILALIVTVAMAYCALAAIAVAGVRPDLGGELGWVAFKAGLSLAFAGLALPLILRLARPGGTTGAWPAMLLGLLALVVVAVLGAEAKTGLTALVGRGFPHCVVVIAVLAAPAAVAMFMWLSRQAPRRPAMAGAAAGLAAGGLAAAGYALSCPVDSLAFVAAWYSVAILLCAGAGAVAGRLTLKW